MSLVKNFLLKGTTVYLSNSQMLLGTCDFIIEKLFLV